MYLQSRRTFLKGAAFSVAGVAIAKGVFTADAIAESVSDSKFTNTPITSQIRKKCKEKWDTNYEMIEFCIKNQKDSYKKLKNGVNSFYTQQCKEKWGTNYEMVEFCIKDKEGEYTHSNSKSSFESGSKFGGSKFRGSKFRGSKFGGSTKFRSR